MVAGRLNLWDIQDDGTLLGLSGQTAFLYAMEPVIDPLLSSEDAVGNLMRQAGSFLSILPQGASLTLIIRKNQYALNPKDVSFAENQGNSSQACEIMEARLQYYRSRQFTGRETALVLSLDRNNLLGLGRLGTAWFRPKTALKGLEGKIKGFKEELLTIESAFLSQAPSLGVKARRLGREESIAFYWGRLNPQKALFQTAPRHLRREFSLRSQITQSAIAIEKDSLWIDGKYIAALSLFNFGEEMVYGGIEKFIRRLPHNAEIVACFQAINTETALEKLKKNQRRSTSMVFLGGQKNWEAQARSEDLNELISKVRESGEKLIMLSIYTLVSATSREALVSAVVQASCAMQETLGCDSLIENLSHEPFFWGSFPMQESVIPRKRLATSELGACLLPFGGPWTGTLGPGATFESRENELVRFNPFENQTPKHGMVIGTTGSGKSFSMNYLIMSLFTNDPNIRFAVIDIGGSYKKLTQALGGDYFEVNLTPDFAINPFPSPSVMLDEFGELDTDLLGYLRLLMEKMLIRKLDQVEKRHLETAIRRLYQGCGDEPILEDLVNVLGQMGKESEETRESLGLARELRLYTEGSYGKILNSQSKIRPFESRLTVFDLAHLKDHPELQGPLIFMISFGLARTLKDKSIRKFIVIDEGWEFFNDETASQMVSRLYRTARKFNAAIVSVSQSPRDFLSCQASAAMIANSDWKLFLRLSMGYEVLENFGLNPFEVEAVKTLGMKRRQYGEALLCHGQYSRIVQIRPTPVEYDIATTNAEETVGIRPVEAAVV